MEIEDIQAFVAVADAGGLDPGGRAAGREQVHRQPPHRPAREVTARDDC